MPDNKIPLSPHPLHLEEKESTSDADLFASSITLNKDKNDKCHHQHDHHAHHHHMPDKINRAFFIAIFLNTFFALIEASYAIWANSMSLLADAGHNFGDVLGLLFAGGAHWLLQKRKTAKYSYGFKRTTILAALSNGVLLAAFSAVILVESIRKLIHPEGVNELVIIIVALIGIAINGGTALLFLKGQEDLNIKAAFLHLAYDALLSFAVVVSGLAILITGFVRLDPLVGIMIVGIICYGSWDLLKNSINLILDAVPAQIDSEAVINYLQKIPGVYAIHDLHIWALSTKDIALTAHLTMPQQRLTDEDFLKINHDLKHLFNIAHVTIQVEEGLHADPCGQMNDCL